MIALEEAGRVELFPPLQRKSGCAPSGSGKMDGAAPIFIRSFSGRTTPQLRYLIKKPITSIFALFLKYCSEPSAV
ncbi:MAG: hypothetical protein R3C26_20045 [Calditrichia bacterium]